MKTDFEEIADKSIVKLTESGNIFEIMSCYRKSNGSDVRKLSNDYYYLKRDYINNNKMSDVISSFDYTVDKSTGEVFFNTLSKDKKYCCKDSVFYPVRSYKKTTNRFQSVNELRRTFKKIRNIINCNVTDLKRCKFCTLTYKENMTDTKKLCDDFRKFNQRFKRYIFNTFHQKYEYIAIAEPQGRGAWHMHIIYIFDSKAPFIHYSVYSRIWGLGFVDLRELRNVDNVGAYFSAYLSNIALDKNSEFDCNLSKKEIISKGRGKNKKRLIKGGRLSMYPTKFNILRTSRGIKRPVIDEMLYSEAKKVISSYIPDDKQLEDCCTFRNSIEIHVNDKEGFYNKIFYEFYNVKLKGKGKALKPVIKLPPDKDYPFRYLNEHYDFAKMIKDYNLVQKYKNILVNYDLECDKGYKEFENDTEHIHKLCDNIISDWFNECTVINDER